MALLRRMQRFLRGDPVDAAGEEFATLIRAAQQDPAFRAQVLRLVVMPDRDREALVQTAVQEMRMKGESAAARGAFAALASAEGAATARRLLEA